MYQARIYARFGEKHRKGKRLGRQARPGIELVTSYLPTFRAHLLPTGGGLIG